MMIKYFWELFQVMREHALGEDGYVLDMIIEYLETKPAPFDNEIHPNELAKVCRSYRSGLSLDEGALANHNFELKDYPIIIPQMWRLFYNMLKGKRYYAQPSVSQQRQAPPALFEQLEAQAKKLGAIQVGYIKDIPRHKIFKGKTIPHPNAIIFLVEMDKDAIDTSPGKESSLEVQEGYANLAVLGNKTVKFLRKNGFSAYPSTALGGQVDTVSLAEMAHMGAVGYHGLLIAPQGGARLRISVVYTDIENLPVKEGPNPHAWIRDFCSNCGNCTRSCPVGAIYDEPKPLENGDYECIDFKRCVKYFSANYGCAVCVKVCPFSQVGYDTIKQGFEEAQHMSPALPIPVVKAEPRRVAIIGAGAAGCYAVEALLQKTSATEIHVFERLPLPFGLVRYGVAPDHEEVKSKALYFQRILAHERVRYFGNIALGRDITREQLERSYDAVLVSTGASASRSLRIPGEEHEASLAAQEFVAWYNSHPDHQGLVVPTSATEVAVIGMGNVALDVARMLLKDPAALGSTDISPKALAHIEQMNVQTVHIIGRRGPSQAKFTPKELVELSELEDLDIIVPQNALTNDRPATTPNRSNVQAERNRALFQRWARTPLKGASRQLHFHFFRTPTMLVAEGEALSGVRLERNQWAPEGDAWRLEKTGTHELLPVQLVLRAVGYRSVPLPGLPFDEQRGVLRHRDGRLVDDQGQPLRGWYCSGWVRRGPSGIIGTNKTDAREMVACLLDDYAASNDQKRRLVPLELDPNHFTVDKEGLERLLALERFYGGRKRKTALRYDRVEDMLEALSELEHFKI